MAIQRISVTPLRDGKYPTSQYHNKLVGQINERILENVGGVDGRDLQIPDTNQHLHKCFERVAFYFGSIGGNVPSILNHSSIRIPISRLYNISRTVDPLTLTDEERLTERKESRAEVRAIFTPLVEALFDTNLSRGWVGGGESGAQHYPAHRNDLGDEKPSARAKWVGEVMAAWVSHEANGGDKETEDDDDYAIRDVAPDYERLLAEPQFRFAHEFTTMPPVIDKDNLEYEHTEQVEEEDENGDITEVDVPIEDHKFAIFELVGDGEYILDEGLPTERSITLDKYIWLETPYRTIRKTDDDDETSCEVIEIEKRKITYEDLCLLTYTLTHRVGGDHRAIKQKDLFSNYFSDSLLKVNRATIGVSPAKPYEDTPAAQLFPLRRFAQYWVGGRSGSVRVKEDIFVLPPDDPAGLPLHFFMPRYDPANERFEVEPDIALIEDDLYYAKFVFRVDFYYVGAAGQRQRYGGIDNNQILQFRYIKEETEDPNDPNAMITKYYMKLDDDRPSKSINLNANVNSISEAIHIDIPDHPPLFNDLVPNTRYWRIAQASWNNQNNNPPNKYYISAPRLSTYVKPLPEVHEDRNLTQEKTDTRVFSHIIGDVMSYMRCIATSFSIADPVLEEDEDPDISDSVDTTGTEIQNKITTTSAGIRIIKDYTIERYAKILGIENFITSVDGRDHFSTLPNTDYARAVLSKLNDGINLLRAIRIHGIRASLKLTQTSYEYIGEEEEAVAVTGTGAAYDVLGPLAELVQYTKDNYATENFLVSPLYQVPAQGNWMPAYTRGTDDDGNPTQTLRFFYASDLPPPPRGASYTQIGEPKVLWFPNTSSPDPPTSQSVANTTLEGPILQNKLVTDKFNSYTYYWQVDPWITFRGSSAGITDRAFRVGYLRQVYRQEVIVRDVLMEIVLRPTDLDAVAIPDILRDRIINNPVILDLRGTFSDRSLRGETIVNERRVPLSRTTEIFEGREAHNYVHGAADFALANHMVFERRGGFPQIIIEFGFYSAPPNNFIAIGGTVPIPEGVSLDTWIEEQTLNVDSVIYNPPPQHPRYDGPGRWNNNLISDFYKGGGVQVPQTQQGLVSLY